MGSFSWVLNSISVVATNLPRPQDINHCGSTEQFFGNFFPTCLDNLSRYKAIVPKMALIGPCYWNVINLLVNAHILTLIITRWDAPEDKNPMLQ